MIVVTPCFYPNEEPIKLLRASCIYHNLRLQPYGVGEPWRGTVGGDTHAQFVALPPLLDTITDDLVLFTDGADVLALSSERVITAKYEASGAKMLVSAEPGCYPPRFHEPFVAKYPEPHIWRFPNLGGWIAPPKIASQVLRHLAVSYQDTMEAQARVLSYMIEEDHPITLDTECAIFQTMSGGMGDAVKISPKLGVWNSITRHRPSFIHWNGRGGGQEAAYATLYGQ